MDSRIGMMTTAKAGQGAMTITGSRLTGELLTDTGISNLVSSRCLPIRVTRAWLLVEWKAFPIGELTAQPDLAG